MTSHNGAALVPQAVAMVSALALAGKGDQGSADLAPRRSVATRCIANYTTQACAVARKVRHSAASTRLRRTLTTAPAPPHALATVRDAVCCGVPSSVGRPAASEGPGSLRRWCGAWLPCQVSARRRSSRHSQCPQVLHASANCCNAGVGRVGTPHRVGAYACDGWYVARPLHRPDGTTTACVRQSHTRRAAWPVSQTTAQTP